MKLKCYVVTMLLGLAIAALDRSIALAQYDDFPELSGEYMGQLPPGDFPVPFGEGFLKPAGRIHSSVLFSPDGTEAYWTTMDRQTYVSKIRDELWTKPTLVKLDSSFGIGEPFFSVDGSRLYFLSRRPPTSLDSERERIWFLDRNDSLWTRPQPIDAVVYRHPTHWQFSLAANGNLYFTSEITGVQGEQDIFMSEWEKGSYSDPVNLGDNINSSQRDMTPYIAPDESYLVFARKVPEEDGRTDLFISYRSAAGDWSSAENLGDTINSLQNDLCPLVTSDGKYMFLIRMGGGPNNVYWISTRFIERRKPFSEGDS